MTVGARPLHVAEGLAMHEGDMRGIERVFHEAQRADRPRLIELVDFAELRIVRLGKVRNARQRLVERHPDIAIALGDAEGGNPNALGDIFGIRTLRNPHAHPILAIGPAVVAANQPAVLEEAERQLRGAVAAAVPKTGDFAIRAAPQHDVGAHEGEGKRLVAETRERHHRVPEPAQHGLLGRQHGLIPSRSVRV